jgi:endonuclease/exonuclease/phosphatase family metal-dependent hydrolase
MPVRLLRATLAATAFACLAGTACASRRMPPEFAPAENRAAEELAVMSFNVRYGTADDGADAWPHRGDLALRVVGDFGPDVLGVQEALRFQLDEIGAAFPHLDEIGVGRDDGVEEGEYAAVFFDRTRFDALASGTFWLSDTPDEPGSVSWGNRIPRIVTWVRLRDRSVDRTFYVYNTHWDHESQSSRERSARALLEHIARRAPADPFLILGDFNAGEDNAAFRSLLEGPTGEGRLIDPFRVRHPDATEVGTFNDFEGTSTGERIDAILTSPGWRTREAAIVRSHEVGPDGARYPSDHFPVTAVLDYP